MSGRQEVCTWRTRDQAAEFRARLRQRNLKGSLTTNLLNKSKIQKSESLSLDKSLMTLAKLKLLQGNARAWDQQNNVKEDPARTTPDQHSLGSHA